MTYSFPKRSRETKLYLESIEGTFCAELWAGRIAISPLKRESSSQSEFIPVCHCSNKRLNRASLVTFKQAKADKFLSSHHLTGQILITSTLF